MGLGPLNRNQYNCRLIAGVNILQIDVPIPQWGIYLHGDFRVDFGLPAKVVDWIKDHGLGSAVSYIPILGTVSHN